MKRLTLTMLCLLTALPMLQAGSSQYRVYFDTYTGAKSKGICAADLDAFVVRARGDGRRYNFKVRTDSGFDTPIHQCGFTTRPGVWEEHRLAFKEFVPTFRGRVLTDAPALDPAKVVSVGFLISDKQEGPFKLELAWIQATRCTGKGA